MEEDVDERGDSILHYAANIAPSTQLNLVSGAALQMQSELQWFKAVEFILLEKYRRVRNKDGYTAQQIFIDKHKGLVKEGEKWMRYVTIMYVSSNTNLHGSVRCRFYCTWR